MFTAFSRPLFDGPGARAILEQSYPRYNPPTFHGNFPPLPPIPLFDDDSRLDPHHHPPTPLLDASRRPSEMSSSSVSTSSTTLLTPLTSRGWSMSTQEPIIPNRAKRGGKKKKAGVPRSTNVSKACKPCKGAHLACDAQRPCRTCVRRGKEHLCTDVEHMPRGRPKRSKAFADERAGARAMFKPIKPAEVRMLSSTDLPRSTSSSTLQVAPPPPSLTPPVTQSPEVFEMITALDLAIFGVSPKAERQTKFSPAQYLGRSLLEIIHPEDLGLTVALLRDLFSSLPSPSCRFNPGSMSRQNQPYTASSSLKRSPHIQLDGKLPITPAEGIVHTFPQLNAHVLHANNSYLPYNIRFHIGERQNLNGIGKESDPLAKLHLVASFLPLTNQEQVVDEIDKVEIDTWVKSILHITSKPPISNGMSSNTREISSSVNMSTNHYELNGAKLNGVQPDEVHYPAICRSCGTNVVPEEAQMRRSGPILGEPM